jgi:hypothetical protein
VKSKNTSRASEPNSPRPENTTAHCANSEPSSSYQKAAQDTLAVHKVKIWNGYREVKWSVRQ